MLPRLGSDTSLCHVLRIVGQKAPLLHSLCRGTLASSPLVAHIDSLAEKSLAETEIECPLASRGGSP